MIADALVWKYGFKIGLVIKDGKIVEWPDSWPAQPDDVGPVVADYKAFLDSQKYKEQRAAEYPPVGDQLDVLWKALDYLNNNGTKLPTEALDMLGNKILAVKTKYPKP